MVKINSAKLICFSLSNHPRSGEIEFIHSTSEFYQRDPFYSCKISSDQTTIFGNGQTSWQFDLVFFKYNISSSNIEIVDYPDYGSNPYNSLVPISNNELFFHVEKSSQIHFIKALFDTTNVQEQFHKSLPRGMYNDTSKAVVDDSGETIWNVMWAGIYDLVYSQHNISDFSIIGNKYLFQTSISQSVFLYDVGFGDGVLYFLARLDENYQFYLINATTQLIIKVYQANSVTSYSPYQKPFVVTNAVLSLATLYDDGTRYTTNHIKASSIF